MNFLAHIYLSGDNQQIQIGNFIGDFVKGRAYEKFPDSIRKGILLHRAIDDFTDKHALTKEAVAPLRPVYRRYSGVVVDLFYDHILASEWERFANIPLSDTVDKFHKNLTKNFLHLPSRVKQIVPVLIKSRRLETYAEIAGIGRALEIMSKRTSLPDHTSEAIEILIKNKDLYAELTFQLMADLIEMVRMEWGIEM